MLLGVASMYLPEMPVRSTPRLAARSADSLFASRAPARGLTAAGTASVSPSGSMESTNMVAISRSTPFTRKVSIIFPSRSTRSPLESTLNLPVDTGCPSIISQPS